MIVDDANRMSIAINPTKYDPPLVVDPDGMKPRQISSQLLKPIGHSQIVQPGRDMNRHKLSLCPIGKTVEGANNFVFEQRLGSTVAK
jgi:hypothetical protein